MNTWAKSGKDPQQSDISPPFLTLDFKMPESRNSYRNLHDEESGLSSGKNHQPPEPPVPEPLYSVVDYKPDPPYVHFPSRDGAKELALFLAVLLLGILFLVLGDFQFKKCSWVELKAAFIGVGVITLVSSIYPFCQSFSWPNSKSLFLSPVPPIVFILLAYIIHYGIDKKDAYVVGLMNWGLLLIIGALVYCVSSSFFLVPNCNIEVKRLKQDNNEFALKHEALQSSVANGLADAYFFSYVQKVASILKTKTKGRRVLHIIIPKVHGCVHYAWIKNGQVDISALKKSMKQDCILETQKTNLSHDEKSCYVYTLKHGNNAYVDVPDILSNLIYGIKKDCTMEETEFDVDFYNCEIHSFGRRLAKRLCDYGLGRHVKVIELNLYRFKMGDQKLLLNFSIWDKRFLQDNEFPGKPTSWAPQYD